MQWSLWLWLLQKYNTTDHIKLNICWFIHIKKCFHLKHFGLLTAKIFPVSSHYHDIHYKSDQGVTVLVLISARLCPYSAPQFGLCVHWTSGQTGTSLECLQCNTASWMVGKMRSGVTGSQKNFSVLRSERRVPAQHQHKISYKDLRK